MKNITFSHNWDGKLDKNEFTTIRLHKQGFYQIGHNITFSVGKSKQNQRMIGSGKIVNTQVCKIIDLTEEIAMRDIGKPRQYLIEVLQRMYAHKVFDWSEQLLVIITIKVTGRFANSQTTLGLS